MIPMTLGEFADALAAMPSDLAVYYDWGSATPTTFDSYRGYYHEIALGIDASYGIAPPSTGTLTEKAKAAIGGTFCGWKGGEYVMEYDTPLWVANPGNTSNTRIVGVRNDGWAAIILTHTEDE